MLFSGSRDLRDRGHPARSIPCWTGGRNLRGREPDRASTAWGTSTVVATGAMPGSTARVLHARRSGLVVRFRRARGDARQQIKWIALAGVIVIATFLLLIAPVVEVIDWPRTQTGSTSRAFSLVPTSVGIAILRYRLFDVDRDRRTALVYGSLTVLLGAAYVGMVLPAQAVFSSFAGGSNLAIAVRPSSWRRCSCPCVLACSASSTGASIAAATTRSARSGLRSAAARAGRPGGLRADLRRRSRRRCSPRTSRCG